MNTNTPETNAEAALMTLDCDDSCVEIYIKRDGKHIEGDFVLADFARRLERERDESRKLLRDANRGAERNAHINQSLASQIVEARRELDEARAALSGRTVSCSQCNESARTIAEMREAIREAHEAIDLIHKPLGDETATSGNPCCCPNPPQGRALAAALAKLKPFLK